MMIKKNLLWILIAAGIAAAQSGVVTSSNAQTVNAGIGSSALTLQLGQAASSATPAGLGLECVWSAGALLPATLGGTDIPLPGTAPGGTYGANTAYGTVAIDPNNGTNYESGTSWVAWNPGTSSDCSSVSTSSPVYAYLQTDSVVGNRCLFNSCAIVIVPNPNACGKKIWSACVAPTATPAYGQEVSTLPTTITNDFEQSANQVVDFAGTDIRPEDAQFATQRIVAPCSSIAGTQYDGLGYTAGPGNAIHGLYDDTKNSNFFNIVNWTLPSSYSVFRVGADPIIVAVNQTDGTAKGAGANGFANTYITNIDSDTLAQILDGTLYQTEDVSSQTTGNQPITVFIREPLSGTYNTMEFNVPNTTFNQTSQDFGATQQGTQQDCGGVITGTGTGNPMNISTGTAAPHGARQRAIGTGDELAILFGQTQITPTPPAGALLGYGFWSTANFAGAYTGQANYNTNARYLTVDGVDPLFNGYGPYSVSGLSSAPSTLGPCSYSSGTVTCPAGTIPSQGNAGVADVTLTNVADGSYPIWSFVRLVAIGTSGNGYNAASALAGVGPNFVSFGSPTGLPDFVPTTAVSGAPTLSVVRSHFTPPSASGAATVTCGVVANGTAVGLPGGGNTTVKGVHEPECGGDVGGEVLTIQGDIDYIEAYQAKALTSKDTGQVNLRR